MMNQFDNVCAHVDIP